MRGHRAVTTSPSPFPIGSLVRLRGCAFGEPGAVLRIERRKVVVYWRDLDFLARHSAESLALVDAHSMAIDGHGAGLEQSQERT